MEMLMDRRWRGEAGARRDELLADLQPRMLLLNGAK